MDGLVPAAPAPARQALKPPPFKSANKNARTQVAQWTLPVLTALADHFPTAVDGIARIVSNEAHENHFAACKFVLEALIKDTKTRVDLGPSGITIKIETAGHPVAATLPYPKEGRTERVIEHDPLEEEEVI